MRSIHPISSVAALIVLSACGAAEVATTPEPRIVETLSVASSNSSTQRAFIGELRAADRADLSFEIGGPITDLSVDLGDVFERGDVLGRVDAVPARLALDAVAAQLRSAEAQLTDAELNFNRMDGLDGTGAVSKSAVDAARARLDSALAQVAALRAQVASARERLNDTRLIAPFDGEVADRLAEPSQVVQPGQPIYRVTGKDAGFEAVISVPERLLSSFEIGAQAEIILKPSNLTGAAQVLEIGQSANQSGLYPVTLDVVSGPQDRLRAGLRVEVLVRQSRETSATTVPLSALLAGRDDRSFLFVVDRNTQKLERRAVEIGDINSSSVAVLSGLMPGDLVVTKGVGLLRDGERVEPTSNAIARFN